MIKTDYNSHCYIQKSTFWNCKYHKTSTASKQQDHCLTYFPPKGLEKRQRAQTCRYFYNAKDELCEVDIQTEVSNIQAQAVVHQTCSKPVSRAEEISSVQP